MRRDRSAPFAGRRGTPRPGLSTPRPGTSAAARNVDVLAVSAVLCLCGLLAACGTALVLIRLQAHSHAAAAAESTAVAIASVSVDRDVDLANLTRPLSTAARVDLDGDVRQLWEVHQLLGMTVWGPGDRQLFHGGVYPRRAPAPSALGAAGALTTFTTTPDGPGRDTAAVDVLLPVVGDAKSGGQVIAGLVLPDSAIRAQEAWSTDVLSAGTVAVTLVAVAVVLLLVRHSRRQYLLARRDPLTGVGSRLLLEERAPRLLAPGGEATLFIIDVAGFRRVNDTFGHLVGDELLVALAGRLQSQVSGDDVLIRFGSDDFGVVMAGVGPVDREKTAWRLLDAIRTDFPVGDIALEVDASVGVASFPQHAASLGPLLQAADIAMHTAKHGGLGVSVYSADQGETTSRETRLMAELRTAIDRGELVLHYQPIVSLRHPGPSALEALVRWEHPVRGLLAPGQFIPLAEQTSLIHPLTAWVLERAIAQCRAWHDAGLAVSVGVNLSARSLSWPGLADLVTGTLARYRLPGTALNVEVTESAIVAKPEVARTILNRLREHGVRTSIDDFGSGYTSLSQLRVLPADVMKIDRSLTAGLPDDAVSRAIVGSTIRLAHGLGMQVVAEGVEDAGTRMLLEQFDCDMVQGFHLSPPLTAEDTTSWLTVQGVRPAGPIDLSPERVGAG